LEGFDVYAQLNFTARADIADGTAPQGTGWHTASNELGAPGEPYFIASGWGPKYINSQYGYQIVSPLATEAQSQDTNFTLSTISISITPPNTNIPIWTRTGATAIQVLEGRFAIQIGHHCTYELTTGDVSFIPGGTSFKYWSESYFTKVLVLSQGRTGIDQELISTGTSYDFVTFPPSW
jgi:quercetin dioxygenase-like cupin family protein